MNRLSRLGVALFALSTSALGAFEKTIDSIVEEARERHHVPGIAVALVTEGGILYCSGYGLRDQESGEPVTEHTPFLIGSNTKAFTSLLIGELADEGALTLDDPVIKHIPEFRLHSDALTSEVTIRDILAHRTGISRNDALWYIIRDFAVDDVLKVMPLFDPVCPPRECFQYNNFMYVVAQKVIETITGLSWEQALEERVFSPLGMKRSGASEGQFLEAKEAAAPHAFIGGKQLKIPLKYPCSTQAASAIYSTASDMSLWLQLQLKNDAVLQLLSPSIMEEMHEAQIAKPLEGTGYGLGWEVDSFRGKKHVWHNGTVAGYISDVSFLPGEKVGLVILTNSSTGGLGAISQIKTEIYDHLFEPPEDLSAYVGQYAQSAYGTLDVSLDGERLAAKLGKMEVPLRPKRKDVFEVFFEDLEVFGINPYVEFSFIKDEEGQVMELSAPFEAFRQAPPVIFKKI